MFLSCIFHLVLSNSSLPGTVFLLLKGQTQCIVIKTKIILFLCKTYLWILCFHTVWLKNWKFSSWKNEVGLLILHSYSFINWGRKINKRYLIRQRAYESEAEKGALLFLSLTISGPSDFKSAHESPLQIKFPALWFSIIIKAICL